MKCFIHSVNEKITERAATAGQIARTRGTFVFGEKCAQWALGSSWAPINKSILADHSSDLLYKSLEIEKRSIALNKYNWLSSSYRFTTVYFNSEKSNRI